MALVSCAAHHEFGFTVSARQGGRQAGQHTSGARTDLDEPSAKCGTSPPPTLRPCERERPLRSGPSKGPLGVGSGSPGPVAVAAPSARPSASEGEHFAITLRSSQSRGTGGAERGSSTNPGHGEHGRHSYLLHWSTGRLRAADARGLCHRRGGLPCREDAGRGAESIQRRSGAGAGRRKRLGGAADRRQRGLAWKHVGLTFNTGARANPHRTVRNPADERSHGLGDNGKHRIDRRVRAGPNRARRRDDVDRRVHDDGDGGWDGAGHRPDATVASSADHSGLHWRWRTGIGRRRQPLRSDHGARPNHCPRHACGHCGLDACDTVWCCARRIGGFHRVPGRFAACAKRRPEHAGRHEPGPGRTARGCARRRVRRGIGFCGGVSGARASWTDPRPNHANSVGTAARRAARTGARGGLRRSGRPVGWRPFRPLPRPGRRCGRRLGRGLHGRSGGARWRVGTAARRFRNVDWWGLGFCNRGRTIRRYQRRKPRRRPDDRGRRRAGRQCCPRPACRTTHCTRARGLRAVRPGRRQPARSGRGARQA